MGYGQSRQMPSRELTGSLVPVPTSPTDLTTVDTWIRQIYVSNPTGGSITFTVKDKQSTPRNVLGAVAIAANSTSLVMICPDGLYCPGGVNWSAGGAGLEAEVFGFRAG